MHRTRVKICGLTRPGDARAAVELGVDAIGLVFHPPSPRHVSLATARELVADLPPFVTVVALFVDARPERIREVLDNVRVDLLQFHGDETPAACESHGRPWIKALRMRPDLDVATALAGHPRASGLLVDAWHPEVPGGLGESFDWSRLPERLERPLILAGGLHPDNVRAAIRRVRPYAVDVSSGVESGKGLKDVAKMAAFLNQVQQADHGLSIRSTL